MTDLHPSPSAPRYSSQVSVADSGIAASPILPPTAGVAPGAPVAPPGAPLAPPGAPHIQVSVDSDGSLVDWLVQHGADHLTVSRVSTQYR